METTELFASRYEIVVKSVTVPANRPMEIFLVLSRGNDKVESKSRLTIQKMNPIAQFNESFSFPIAGEGKVIIEVCCLSVGEVEVLGEFVINFDSFNEFPASIINSYKLRNSLQNGTITLEIKKNNINKENNKVNYKAQSAEPTLNKRKQSPNPQQSNPTPTLESVLKEKAELLAKYEALQEKVSTVEKLKNAQEKGLAEAVVVNLVRQSKDKDEVIASVGKKAEEAVLELEKVKKNSENTEASLRNELNILKLSQETQKKEINDVSDAFQKAKHGNSFQNLRVGDERDATAGKHQQHSNGGFNSQERKGRCRKIAG
eukprot:TRINITY_DN13024_c0_g1_i3.p1 TRINITY_DN13024_c0_g1~~TRINITY_DN13024_c0_g1_i3.p1  ORF type:complete len:317 (-),score=67.09 TRINITY_DN13024_c0_g1_i3:105-1055(-)